MNTNLNADIRELTADEFDNVAGGNAAAVFAGILTYLVTKAADDVAPEFKVVDKIRTLITQK